MDETLTLISGTIYSVIQLLDERLETEERFRDEMADADKGGALATVIARATGRVEALHAFRKELEAAQEQFEHLNEIISEENDNKPC